MQETARLKELISRHAREGLTPTALPGVSLLRATTTSEPLGEVAEPAVAVIAQGVKETTLGGRVFRHGAGQFAIVPVELPVTGPQGATVRQIGLADSRLAHLARATTWIRGHYDQTLRVEDLAALSAMSVTSFHRHFRALTSMTPIQFQKQIRLHEARTRLLADPGDIAGTGHAVGYGSPSQFSREYRRMFGVPPSRHAPALR